jgi:hypothetical protein
MQPYLLTQIVTGMAHFWTRMNILYARFKASGGFRQFRAPFITGRRAGLGLLLLLGLSLGFYGMAKNTQAVTEPTPAAAKAEPVLCISAVQGRDGVPQVVFQRAENTLEEAMIEQGLEALVQGGFTVTHRACFESWQAGADFVTDGEVQLPEHATEADFVRALIQWKMQRQKTQ